MWYDKRDDPSLQKFCSFRIKLYDFSNIVRFDVQNSYSVSANQRGSTVDYLRKATLSTLGHSSQPSSLQKPSRPPRSPPSRILWSTLMLVSSRRFPSQLKQMIF
ncbi:jg125 [Pararge aegeria aegeria]|uniref:Jg125 protein n=1 Tax=Pararge aegeria aegeria TaxID=348720 RepID=A0A8S4QJM8_9NEOP|nr:jg125 [Pararge aegeria aegeria]